MKSKPKFYQQIIWDRGSGPDHNINYLDPTTELIFWLVKETPKVFKVKNKYVTEIWRINPDTNNTHPAPFPLVIPEIAILLTTQENDVVLDPYMGSGTTAVVAKKFRRNFVGIELNPNYCKIANDRLRQDILL